ncbi:MAG: ogr/Delta-like zinc finger family protein [Desulfatibacillaceae bacterium]
MAIETKEQVLDKIMRAEVPCCPHCQAPMSIWETPPMNFSDGLGWGTPYMYVCFNDECSLYKAGWENIEENFAHKASHRCINYPGSEVYECMPVFSSQGGRGQIVDEEVFEQRRAHDEAVKKGFSDLAEAYRVKDHEKARDMLLNATVPNRVRVKAAEMVGDIGTVEDMELLLNAKFGNQILAKQVDKAVAALQVRTHTRECPFCAEIIKTRAKVCKHCGKDVAGE